MLNIFDCNALASLPDSFGNLSSLETLYIQFCNALTSLPDSFLHLGSYISFDRYLLDRILENPRTNSQLRRYIERNVTIVE
jgi:Leucine-rich repeat (LRR) protein